MKLIVWQFVLKLGIFVVIDIRYRNNYDSKTRLSDEWRELYTYS